jgi:hypothetical protein
MVDPAQKYRITSDGVAYTTVLPNTGRTDKRTRTRRHFVIFPWLWLETLSKPRASNATFLVAAVLLYEARQLINRGQKPEVSLTTAKVMRVGVDKRGKRKALWELERCKLVDVQRNGNKNPLVTVRFLE